MHHQRQIARFKLLFRCRVVKSRNKNFLRNSVILLFPYGFEYFVKVSSFLDITHRVELFNTRFLKSFVNLAFSIIACINELVT